MATTIYLYIYLNLEYGSMGILRKEYKMRYILMDICKTDNRILKLVENIMGILMRIIALLVFYEFHIV